MCILFIFLLPAMKKKNILNFELWMTTKHFNTWIFKSKKINFHSPCDPGHLFKKIYYNEYRRISPYFLCLVLLNIFHIPGLDINVCPIVLYQWKLTSDKYILYHGCPTGQVKKWPSYMYLLNVIFYNKNVLLCHF